MRYFLFIALALVWSGLSTASDSSVFGNAKKGKAYFSKRCAMCHGIDGHGKNGMAPNFSVEWERFTKSDDELAAHIREEYKDSNREIHYEADKCPRHPSILDDEMDDILAFLRRLADRNHHGDLLDSSDDFFDKQFEDFDQDADDAFHRDDDFFKR